MRRRTAEKNCAVPKRIALFLRDFRVIVHQLRAFRAPGPPGPIMGQRGWHCLQDPRRSIDDTEQLGV